MDQTGAQGNIYNPQDNNSVGPRRPQEIKDKITNVQDTIEHPPPVKTIGRNSNYYIFSLLPPAITPVLLKLTTCYEKIKKSCIISSNGVKWFLEIK